MEGTRGADHPVVHPLSMGLRINTNIASLRTMRHLQGAGRELATQASRLSSGRRIPTANLDAAGLGIGERMRSLVRSGKAVERGIQDGLSLLGVAEGALQQTMELVQRTRELALQSASGVLGDSDRVPLEAEAEEIASEAMRLIEGVEFNGQGLFYPPEEVFQIRVSESSQYADEVIDITFGEVTRVYERLQTMDIGTAQDASDALPVLDGLIDFVGNVQGQVGADTNRLRSALSSTGVRVEQLAASSSRILDADIALEGARMVRASLLQQSSIAVLAQANLSSVLALELISGS